MEKKPRSGFTTGTCAAAAAKAAAFLLCSGKRMDQVHIMTPGGRETVLKIQNTEKKRDFVRCAVIKDSGDDPDVTNRTLICAAVQRIPLFRVGQQADRWYGSEAYPGVYVTGGEGIGIVTKQGLSCPVGKHAINPVPRTMILEEVFRMKEEWGETEPLLVTVEIPAGKELAEKTFNPRLGIEGGLSVLGTTGIVEPMSEDALVATIRLDIHMKLPAAAGI
ncbi:cobalt-precorrin-5B (C(1))-methyltransferase [Clostridium sp. AM58-1XD]|nr:cobalt-precorrin-5B (C(1))-methyltransferase [Clostridium sp. AM58-1XD]